MSDPSRKPSRTRAAEAAAGDGGDTGRRAPKGEGWAKAKPKFEHTKTFKPRERTAAAPDPARGEPGERPKRAFKPRDDQFIDDRRKPAGGPRKPGGKPAFGDKPSGGRSFGKPAAGGAARPGGSRPSGPRTGPGGGSRGGPRGGSRS